MKNRLIKLTFFLTAFFSFALTAQNTDGWVYKNEKEGVKVYYRKTSDVYEVKLITSIKTSLSGIITLFQQVENYPKWGYKVSESKLLKQVSDTESYYYSKIDFPWPMDDRDLVMHSKMEQDPNTKIITSKSYAAPEYIPESKGMVRILKADTKWTLIPGAGGWLYVEYYIHSSPGGSIPDWMVNMAVDVGPRETIKSMKEILQKPEYQSAKLAYIKE